jgi:outer membrane protein
VARAVTCANVGIEWDLTLANNTSNLAWQRVGSTLAWLVMLLSIVGCRQTRYSYQEGLADRIIPPLNNESREAIPAPKKTSQETTGVIKAQFGKPRSTEDVDSEGSLVPVSAQGGSADLESTQTITLSKAIETAFRQQPRLRVFMEGVEQAMRGEDIAFAPFLPMVFAGASVGGFDVNAGGLSVNVGQPSAFTFLPALGAVPIGLDIKTGYELAELKLQWLICDFGRRMGRYRQAGLATDIAQLQSERAYQTVANEVSVAYYQVLRARALRKTAFDAVRRAEDDLKVAKNLKKAGALEKEKVLRVEVLLAEDQRLLDASENAEAVAVAALNLAIGLNVNAPTGVQETSDVPTFSQSLADCLQTAVGQRREFQVARQSIEVADEGRRVAKAGFAPRIVAEGALLDFQQSAPRGHADLAVGAIKLEWGLFEGGKRVAELRISDSKNRAAVAQAETIADTIAFQVTESYRHLMTARRGIELSRPAVTQAEENNRLVRARAKLGDATTAEITDSESTLTRAQQAYLNSIHDYLIALSRLEYAMGVTEGRETRGEGREIRRHLLAPHP